MTARSSGGVPSLDLSSCQSPVPVSLTSPSIPRSMKSMSVPNYPQFQPINPPHPKPSSLSSPRQPPTFARSNSFRSPLPRGKKKTKQRLFSSKVLIYFQCLKISAMTITALDLPHPAKVVIPSQATLLQPEMSRCEDQEAVLLSTWLESVRFLSEEVWSQK